MPQHVGLYRDPPPTETMSTQSRFRRTYETKCSRYTRSLSITNHRFRSQPTNDPAGRSHSLNCRFHSYLSDQVAWASALDRGWSWLPRTGAFSHQEGVRRYYSLRSNDR